MFGKNPVNIYCIIVKYMYTQYRFLSFHIHFDSSRVVVGPGIVHDCHKLRPPRTEAGNPTPPVFGDCWEVTSEILALPNANMCLGVLAQWWHRMTGKRGEVEVDLKTLNIGWVVLLVWNW